MNLIERLAARMKIDKDGCWLWMGKKDNDGYGLIKSNGRRMFVHRVAYEELVGPITSGIEVHHNCEKKNCFHPDCIEALTPTNHRHWHHPRRARVTKAHFTPFKRGINHHKAMLNEEQVIGIMARMLTGRESQRAISRVVKVSHHSMGAIWSGETWGHLFNDECNK